ncbi:NAD(P)-dependent oxidoreductase [Candidatus Thioglobus sp.]|nr:NAD(P)-dependent oxidoreductase [Candidatus Thioglobus sp.]
MKVAVTGASGFIGQHVLNYLNNLSVDVVAITRLKHANLPKLVNGLWIEFDLQNPPENMFSLMGNPDVLIHLAWQGLPNYKSLHHFESELPVQYDFLSTLIKEGLQSVVVVGTCFEYGMQSNSLSEKLNTNPSNPYGFAKDCLRKQLEFLKTQHNFKFTWARLFYLYGDGQSDSSIYPQLKRAIQNSEIKFDMSEGKQLRDYLPVEKVAKYLVDLALLNKDIGVVNVCSGEPISVKDLVENWLDENKWDIELNLGFYPYPNYEPMNFWGDSFYLRSLLN